MYISASLPPLYGEFKQIQRDNYPFRNAFAKYLEAISDLGLRLDMDADLLVGVIEDALLRNARLPDIPEGNEPVKFRFTLDNETIISYFEKNELANKTIIMLIVRMTLRLSVQFGTSLSRLTLMIREIRVGSGSEDVNNVEQPPIHITKTVSEPVSKEDGALKPNDVLERLNNLVEKGDQLLSDKSEADNAQVVETNPLLKDFF